MGAAVNGNGRYGPVVIFTFGVHEMQCAIPIICLFHLSFGIVGRGIPARVLHIFRISLFCNFLFYFVNGRVHKCRAVVKFILEPAV